MLQQTKVKKVLEYYQNFVDRFPTLQHLARAELGDVLKQWEGLGYYARARNLRKAAKVLVEQMNGEVPADYDSFRGLPRRGRLYHRGSSEHCRLTARMPLWMGT